MFNWLSVITLLIIEVATAPMFGAGLMETITGTMVNSSSLQNSTASKSPDFLKVLTGPFTKSVIQLDKKVLKGWAEGDSKFDNATILKTHCKDGDKNVLEICPYLFAYLGEEGQHIGDVYIGIIILVLSISMLSGCLLGMVKCLNSILGDKVRAFIEKSINTDIPVKGLGWLTGYLYMVLGAVITVLVQSSSVFTSTLTPLAGAGLVSLERAYPMTLGSNIGTTTTSLLASLAADSADPVEKISALQIALVHLFFNIFGILLFYPIPFMRWPISAAKLLGKTTAKYRWFSIAYLIFMFFVFPLFVFGVSLGGPLAMYLIILPLGLLLIFIIILNVVQKHKSEWLPVLLKDWSFLPLPLRSLSPYDRIITRAFSCCKCCRTDLKEDDIENKKEHHNLDNLGFQADNNV